MAKSFVSMTTIVGNGLYKMKTSIIGRKFGKLTVLKEGRKTRHNQYYICKCDCGNIKEVRGDNLKSGRTKTCGCINRDIIGQKFGMLTVVSKSEKVRIRKNGWVDGNYYNCKCDCGNDCVVARTNLISGNQKSCGCLHKKPEHLKKIAPERKGYINGTNVNILEKILETNSKATEKVKGVIFNTQSGKWESRIMLKGKSYWLGAYLNKSDAIAARKTAEEKLFGDFLEWYYETYPDKKPKEETE